MKSSASEPGLLNFIVIISSDNQYPRFARNFEYFENLPSVFYDEKQIIIIRRKPSKIIGELQKKQKVWMGLNGAHMSVVDKNFITLSVVGNSWLMINKTSLKLYSYSLFNS